MRIQVEQRGQNPLIFLEGRFDAHVITDFRAATEPFLLSLPITLDIDLAGVVFIDSSALAELLRLTRAVQGGAGYLVLHNPSHAVRVIFELTALDTAFTIEQTPGLSAAAHGSGSGSGRG